MPRKPGDAFSLEDVRITYRNFHGVAQRFNEEGNRNFCVILDDETAKAMEADGWNVRWQPPRDPEDPPRAILKVNLRYRSRDGRILRPPRVVMITSKGKTQLDEEMVGSVDWAEIQSVDMMINPYEYQPGKFSAYLKSIYVTLAEDELELKYLDVPDNI